MTTVQKNRAFGTIFLFVFAVLAGRGILDEIIDRAFLEDTIRANKAYLSEVEESILVNFIVLSGVKNTLDMVEGSSFGVLGISVEVGDAAESALDVIDFSWYALLIAFVSFVTLGAVFDLSGYVDHIFLAATLILAAILLAGKLFPNAKLEGNFWRVLRKLVSISILVTCFLYIVFPLSFKGLEVVNTNVLDPLQEASICTLSSESSGLMDWVKDDLIRIDFSSDRITEVFGYLKEKTVALTSAALSLASIYILETVLLPLGFILGLWWLLKTSFLLIAGSHDKRGVPLP